MAPNRMIMRPLPALKPGGFSPAPGSKPPVSAFPSFKSTPQPGTKRPMAPAAPGVRMPMRPPGQINPGGPMKPAPKTKAGPPAGKLMPAPRGPKPDRLRAVGKLKKAKLSPAMKAALAKRMRERDSDRY